VVSTAIEILNARLAEVGESLLEFLQFVTTEHIVFPALGSPRHDRTIVLISPYVRLGYGERIGAPAMPEVREAVRS
jgi:hypothetical protein